MYVVALARIAGDPDAQAADLGAIVGASAYDARIWAKGLLPRVLFRSESHADAAAVLQALSDRGHGAVMCHTSDAVPSASMVRVRRFLLDDLGMSADGPTSDAVGWDDIAAVIHVLARTIIARTQQEKVVVYRARGGPATVTRDRTTSERDAENVLYLFMHDTARPWCLRERDARYLGLGDQMGTTNRENFDTTLAIIRSRATRAAFDDRFAFGDMPVSRNVSVRGHDQPESTSAQPRDVDLILHVLKLWLTRESGTPYR